MDHPDESAVDARCRRAIDTALRALAAARAGMAGEGPFDAPGVPRDPQMAALGALEAARTARVRVEEAVALLTERALEAGARPEALGIGPDDG